MTKKRKNLREMTEEEIFDIELGYEDRKRLEENLKTRAKKIRDEDIEMVREETLSKVGAIREKVSFVVKMIRRVRLLYEMVFDKSYRVEWTTVAIVVAALLYFISPVDFLPDFIPFVGYIDDAFVIWTALSTIDKEVKNYMRYRGLREEIYY